MLATSHNKAKLSKPRMLICDEAYRTSKMTQAQNDKISQKECQMHMQFKKA